MYAIPSPKTGNAFAYVAKDWQVSGTTTFRDGFAAPLLTFGDESGVSNNHTRYNCVAPIHYQLSNCSLPYALPSSFQDPAWGTFGNCPRDPLIAPCAVSAIVHVRNENRAADSTAELIPNEKRFRHIGFQKSWRHQEKHRDAIRTRSHESNSCRCE